MSTCWECGKPFPSGRRALKQHRKSTNHTECRRCYDMFNSAQDRHLNSKIHRGSSVQCPLCMKAYTTATGIVNHLESGTCPNTQNLSRDALYRLVRSRDPQGVISKKLIGWTGEVEYEATVHTWNGSGYECYLCHRVFQKIQSLDQHLKSPVPPSCGRGDSFGLTAWTWNFVDQQSYYHCPKVTCRSEFKTLASLISHLESESCGYIRFSNVQNRVKEMMLGGKLIGH
ncbi:uncharacterized protein PpBr36_11379 [Pyricularia pennisetigena]|uniref:uncharacterized protein n=1 Tax=Pyricularia pennisetigena TaxID=1578925 RepID=UPI001152FDCE|nr:uncharacterized protein PpBr36_11379 [Pyricularia pennisetigena]TLS20420.1 hypothetical protein PpBr36_11379 [Pyricularia pennisetigena]